MWCAAEFIWVEDRGRGQTGEALEAVTNALQDEHCQLVMVIAAEGRSIPMLHNLA
jgi:hypothetical protein